LSIFLLSAALTSLTGCGKRAVKPSPPPEIACQVARTAEIPDWPDDFLLDGPEFAIRLIGVIVEERRLEQVELDCLAELRAAGVIR
jgi:predicted small lipoprotein YifL